MIPVWGIIGLFSGGSKSVLQPWLSPTGFFSFLPFSPPPHRQLSLVPFPSSSVWSVFLEPPSPQLLLFFLLWRINHRGHWFLHVLSEPESADILMGVGEIWVSMNAQEMRQPGRGPGLAVKIEYAYIYVWVRTHIYTHLCQLRTIDSGRKFQCKARTRTDWESMIILCMNREEKGT